MQLHCCFSLSTQQHPTDHLWRREQPAMHQHSTEMDRTPRKQPDGKLKTSQLIQQLAAQRERKLQQSGTPAAGDEVVAASSIPLPGSFDEEDVVDVTAAAADDRASASSSVTAAPPPPHATPRSRLVRQDRAHNSTQQQQQQVAAAAGEADVQDLADLLQGVGISSQRRGATATGSSRGGAGAQHPQHSTRDAGASGDEEEESIDSDSDSDSDSDAVVARRRRPAAPAAAAANKAAAESDDEQQEAEEDVASVDSADSDDSAGQPAGTGSGVEEEGDGSSAGTSHSAAAVAAGSAAPPPMVLEGGFRLDGAVAAKLYPHQVIGVKWLWSLHRIGKGGIHADDMGLGKTMQCSAFLAGALAASRSSSTPSFSLHSKPPSAAAGAGPASTSTAQSAASAHVPVRALIVAPKTLLAHWEKELRVCGMGRATYSFYGSSEGERSTVLTTLTRRGGIMLTTYGMVLHNASQIMSGKGSAVARDIDEHEDEEDPLCPVAPQGRRILWDYIILDEGHKIKNARTQLAQRLREIRARVRIIISGTPVQNNLGELHSLLEFAVPGLLGSAKDFKTGYEKPINAGQDRSATLRVRELGAARAAELRQLVAPYILRREKKDVLGGGSGNNNNPTSSSNAAGQGSGSSGSGSAVGQHGVVGSSTAGVIAAAAATTTASSSGDITSAGASSQSTATAATATHGPAPMGRKTDLVVWLKLTALQRHIYEAFLHSDAVKAALNSSKSPLAALTVLKKVCDHPALLSERATKLVVEAASKPARRKGLDTTSSASAGAGDSGKSGSSSSKKRRDSLDDFIVADSDEDDGEEEGQGGGGGSGSEYSGSDSNDGSSDDDDHQGSSSSAAAAVSKSRNSKAAARAAVAASLDTQGFSDEFLSWATASGGQDLEAKLLADVSGARGQTDSSCKSLFVAALLDELVAKGHRTLVFSQSRVMLDILQAAVKARGWNFCRIDGSMAKAEARQAEVERFQTAAGGAKGIPVFLLTTQVGGLGLTLTAADRVVIVDPSWNPATDNQSVDRAYRIGQSRDVVVYRLVTCGTVEEKIYRKQVFKGGLSKAGMEEGIQLRYFTHQEMHELFKWDPDALNTSETQLLIKQQHAAQLRDLQRQQPPALTSHVCWVEEQPLCAGTSQHGLLFSLEDPEGKDLNLSMAAAGSGLSGSSAGSSGRRFPDSGWHPRKGRSQQAGGSGSGNGGQQGQRLRGHPDGGAAGGGGSGSSGGGLQPSAAVLDEMMQSLHIGGGGSRGGLSATAAVAATGGRGAGGWPPQQQQQSQKVQELTKRIKQLQAQLQSSSDDLQQLGPRLPDGGAKIAARLEGLQAALREAQAELKQVDPQAAAALAAPPAASAAAASQPHAVSASAGSNMPPRQQQQQPYGAPPPSHPQQQQQQWQQQPRQPPPPQYQQPWHQKQRQPQPPPPPRQQQQQWTDALPMPPGSQPPPPPPRSQQPAAAQAHAAGSTGSGQQQQQQRSQPDVQTLDGRVPTVDELRQRKRVLKKALQHEDKTKAQLQAQGRQYPAEKEQQWRQMYAEYKEIKTVLQAVDEAEATELQQQQGESAAATAVGGSRQQGRNAVIDLT